MSRRKHQQPSNPQGLPTYEEYILATLNDTVSALEAEKYASAVTQLEELASALNHGRDFAILIMLHEKIERHYAALRETDIKVWAWYLCHVGTAYAQQGAYETAYQAIEEMVGIGAQLHDEDLESTAWQNLGVVKFQGGDREGARECYHRALAIKERYGDRLGVAQVQNNLATMAVEDDDLETAEALLQSSLAIKRQLRGRPGLSAAYGTLGNLSVKRGNCRRARRYFLQALEIDTRLSDPLGIAQGHLNLGNVLIELRQVDDGLAHYQTGLDIARRFRLHSPEEMLQRALALALHRNGRQTEAIEQFANLARVTKKLGRHFDEGMAYHDAAVIAAQLEDYSQAVSWYRKAIKRFTDVHDLEWLSRSCWEMAECHRKARSITASRTAIYRSVRLLESQQAWELLKEAFVAGNRLFFRAGRVAWALALFQRERAVLMSLRDQQGLAWRLAEMGSVLVDYNHAHKAIPILQESLELYRELKDGHAFAMVLNDLARSRIEAGQLQKGWDDYSRLKQIAEQDNDRALLLLATMNMAETARRRDDYATAISLSETAISLAEALHDLEALPMLYNNIGLAYEDQQQHKEARRYFWESIHAARRCRDHEREANALSSLGSMAMRGNRLTSALSYYDRALKVLDDHDKDTRLIIQQNRLQCFIGLWMEDEVEAVISEILNLSQELCDYEAGEDAARRTAFAYLTHGNYDAAAEAFVYSLALSSYRGSTDTYINLAVVGRVLDDGAYPIAAREQLLQLFEQHLVQIISEPSAQGVLRLLEDIRGITPEE